MKKELKKKKKLKKMVEGVSNAADRKIQSANGGRFESDTSPTALNATTIEINFVRNKLENFQNTIIQDVDRRISAMIEEILQELRQHELRTHEFRNFNHSSNGGTTNDYRNNTWSNRVEQVDKPQIEERRDARKNKAMTADKETKEFEDKNFENSGQKMPKRRELRQLPDKIFITRESYLTALLKVDHMRSIYHIFQVILLSFTLNSLCHDFFVEGRINFGLRTFKSGFKGIEYVFVIWLLEHVFVFSLYHGFALWATVRNKLQKQDFLARLWSNVCLSIHIVTQLIFGYIATAYCLKLDLPFVSAAVLLLETIRLMMKMHSFVRTNASRVIEGKQKIDNDNNSIDKRSSIMIKLPSFSSYLYYLFAPTLIYRASYPRTSQIRWKFALARFIEVVAIAFLYSYIHERYIEVHFQNFGRQPLTASAMIVKLFGMLMPSIVIFLCGFYLILHAWLNLTAELLRFGDRMFYKDWWTSATYDAYYRNWNVVVHDWLYEYIYKDCYNHLFKGSKMTASIMVFAVSALVHEHILGFAMQLFFPVMFIFFFCIGFIFIVITRRLPKNLGNIFLWFSLVFGNGMMVSLYCMEFFARQNCPKVYENWVDYLTPAIMNCQYNGSSADNAIQV